MTMMQVKSTTKTSQAYRRIKGLIEEGRLGAGEKVTETKISKLVGMSRGPVRESLLRLEAEGILKNRGNRRSRVVAYVEDQNPAEILQRYELREQIESGAVRLASKNMTGWQLDHLMELAKRVDDAWEAKDRQGRYDAVGQFHHFLMANCGNPLFLDVWQTHRLAPLQPRSSQLDDTILAVLPEGKERRGSLVEVVQAIVAHDPDRAESLMKLLIRRITDALRNTLWKIDAPQPS
jgi:DNA-binding GntR family transcriptional regulator